MKLEEAMRFVQSLTQRGLRTFYKTKRQQAHKIDTSAVDMVNAIEEFSLRPAKRIRPFLCWLAYGASASEQPFSVGSMKPAVLSAMVGLELFHTFALIHDDIMDQDSTRRGKDSMHVMLGAYAQVKGASDEVLAKSSGTGLAILAGDLALCWADELLLKTNNVSIGALYRDMKEEVMYGQGMDLLYGFATKKPSKKTIDELKTARYTFMRPLQIGAALASDKQANAFNMYGISTGMVFQMRDDVLDGQLSQTAFERKAKPFIDTAERALQEGNIAPWAKRLCTELLIFVGERTK